MEKVIHVEGCYIDLAPSGKVLTTINECEIAKINSRFKKECEYSDLVEKIAEINHPIVPIY